MVIMHRPLEASPKNLHERTHPITWLKRLFQLLRLSARLKSQSPKLILQRRSTSNPSRQKYHRLRVKRSYTLLP
jgi:hypothetical protein